MKNMDLSDSPHRTTSTSSDSKSELFICFTSGLSPPSMKLSSKCILNPGRSREPAQISLSNSLSRRLKSNGSIKGGQASPMFPTGGKKRGCGFENPEPSSPKVTCIGQVRVKTKKQGKRFRARSKRRGEASFRKIEQNAQVVTNPDLSQRHSQAFQYQNLQQGGLPHRNQRWVQIPLTICEALKAFGSELNCFLPCRSACMSSEGQKEEKAAAEKSGYDDRRDSSCGAVSRWLVSMQEDEMKAREIELEVGNGERVERSSQRRHAFDEVEFNEDNCNGQGVEDDEEKPRVSVCIPPKNALMFMRCRSDPVRMAALANKFWESPIKNDKNDGENHEENCEEEEQHLEEDIEQERVEVKPETKGEDFILFGKRDIVEASDVREEHEIPKAELEADIAELEIYRIQEKLEIFALSETHKGKHDVEAAEEKEKTVEVQEEEEIETVEEVLVDAELQQVEESQLKLLEEEREEELDNEVAQSYPLQSSKENISADSVMSVKSQLGDCESEAKFEALAKNTGESMEEKEQQQQLTTERTSEDEGAETMTLERSLPDRWKSIETKSGLESSKRESQRKPEKTVLPDCLLLMMCEPKLSMEVSKETWVCRADFIRWLPERPVKKIDCGERISNESKTSPQQQGQQKQQQGQVHQPLRSCSYPEAAAAAALSMATVIEKKLVGSNAYEPFVLTRCKSEPMRSAAKLSPEPCFWKNRKIEPHRPATFGVAAARVGC